jgi:hypothetical protein
MARNRIQRQAILQSDPTDLGKAHQIDAEREQRFVDRYGETDIVDTVTLTLKEYNDLKNQGNKQSKRKREYFLMLAFKTDTKASRPEKFDDLFIGDNNMLGKLIFNLPKYVAQEFYILLARRPHENNIVKLPIDDLTDKERKKYLDKLRVLMDENMIRRVDRHHVQINPLMVGFGNPTIADEQEALWLRLCERDKARKEKLKLKREGNG